jgi:hypothetical protein
MSIETDNKKIIILGDSFGFVDPKHEYLWQLSVASTLKRDLVSIAENGASSNWLLSKVLYVESEINEDDLVILIVPYWERMCIWPQSPDLTSLACLDSLGKHELSNAKWEPYTKQERQAFESYFLYLKNDEFIRSIYVALMHWINSIGSRLKHKPLILFGFESEYSTTLLNNCNVASGCLFDIAIKEFKSIDIWNQIIENTPFVDPRINHLSERNHTILAEKLIEYYTHGTVPDLTHGFYQFFIEK